MPIRFHLDEHISAHIAAGLRRRNIVLVTRDDDFLRLHAQGLAHAGIGYCHQQSMTAGEMLRRLILVHDLLTAGEMSGRVEYL